MNGAGQPASRALPRPSERIGRWFPKLFSALCVLLVGLAVWHYSEAEREEIREAARRNLSAIADLKREQIANWRSERFGDARFFARAPFVGRDVQALLDHPSSPQARAEVLAWMKLLKGGDRYQQVALFDAQFSARLSVPEAIMESDSDLRTHLTEAFQTNDVRMFDLHRDEGGEVHLDLLFPVMAPGATNGAPPLAVILLRLDPYHFLYPLLRSWPMPSESAETVLVRKRGEEVVFLNELRQGTNAPLNLRFPVSHPTLAAARALHGEMGRVLEGLDYDGRPVLAVFQHVPDSPWVIGAKVDQAEIYAPLREQAVHAGLIGTALVLAVLGGSGWFWRRREAAFLRLERAADEARLAQEEKYHRYVSASPLGIFILRTDGYFVEVNPAACELVGLTANELVGKPFAAIVAPESQAGAKAHFETLLATGSAVGEVRLRRKTGTRRDMLFSAAKLSDGRLIAFGQDVTALRQAETAERETRLRLAGLVDSAMDGILTVDETQRIVIFNPAAERMFGRLATEMLGQPLDCLLPERFRAAHPGQLQKFASTGETRRMSGTLGHVSGLRADGTEFPIESSISRISVAGRQYLTAILRDVTERARAEHRLRSFAALGQRLNATRQAEEAARIIAGLADELFGWDACTLDRYDAAQDRSFPVLNIDVLDGRRQDVIPAYENAPPSARMRRLIESGPEMILRQPPLCAEADAVPFGDTQRPSASILGVPIRDGQRVIGVFSIQSYRVNAYTRDDLDALQALADHCGGALARMQKEAEVRASEQKLRQLLQQAPIPLALADREGAVKFVNDRFTQIFGYTLEELPTTEDWWRLAYPDPAYRQKVIQQWESLLDQAAQTGTDIQPAEYRVACKDGHECIVEISAARFEEGLLVRFLDVTDHKAAEAALRASEERLRLAAEAAHMGAWERDLNSDRLYWSPGLERMNAFEPGTFPGTHEAFLALVLPEDRPRLEEARAQAMRTAQGDFQLELRFRRPDGGTRWGLVRGQVIRNEAGVPERIIGIEMDVTERHQLEAQVRHAQKMDAIGTLAGGVAHDFNNLLTVVMGNASLLLESSGLAATETSLVQQILNASERGSRLTRQLLLFSRKQAPRPGHLALNETVADMTKMLHRILGEDIVLQASSAPGLPQVHADASMMEQVVMNLVVNARDAMPDGGRLELETTAGTLTDTEARLIPGAAPGPFVCLRATDTGCGIPPENLPRIFEPFFTTKELGKGTGLGLATVYGVIQQHHGWIQVESQVGEGTTFRIFLPASAEASAAKPAAPARKELPKGTGTILLVEDEGALREQVARVLRMCGYTVLEAVSGRDALRVWQEHQAHIELLLTDIVMPEGVSGRELAQRLSAESSGRLKVVYTSGYSPEIHGRGAAMIEGSVFLEKPFTPQELAETVRKSLAQMLPASSQSAGSAAGLANGYTAPANAVSNRPTSSAVL